MTTTTEFESDYYKQNYPNYDAQNPPRKMRFYAQMAERFGPAGDRSIHDMGCAFGRFLGSLGSQWQPFGSDVSQYAIAEATKLHSRATFKVASGTASPFERKFGVVTAFDVIEHIPDLDGVARSVKEQLADGGLFLFVVPVYDGLSGPVIKLLDKDPTHVHKWPRQRWLDWAGSHFDVLEWRGILRYLVGGYYLHVTTKLFRGHTPAIIVACRKR